MILDLKLSKLSKMTKNMFSWKNWKKITLFFLMGFLILVLAIYLNDKVLFGILTVEGF